ncbi:MAG: methanogenesis marker 2 protein [Desulfarculus sp.]|nr:MAG: methanogenesis marker 2 protein [Desulfarculus sp.]
MELDLAALAQAIREYPGLTRKRPIAEVYKSLVTDGPAGPQLPSWGDDAAAIPFPDGYLLLACDGIMTRLLVNEPYAAGKAAVMVVVGDIYSMGGRPLAMVNVLASGEPEQRAQVVAGIQKGCQKLRVPMVGGHLHPDAPAEQPALSVSILGWAQKLLRSHLARPGDDLIVACDLSGRAGCQSVVSWDANSGKTSEELLARLEVLPHIAEQELARACKDISNAGLIGTAAIMMENSGFGAEIDLAAIPRPPQIELSAWLTAFMSFGFVLSADPGRSAQVLAMFRERELAAEVIGKVQAEPLVSLVHEGRRELLMDLARQPITGISHRSP